LGVLSLEEFGVVWFCLFFLFFFDFFLSVDVLDVSVPFPCAELVSDELVLEGLALWLLGLDCPLLLPD
jgi:hypothetical protein